MIHAGHDDAQHTRLTATVTSQLWHFMFLAGPAGGADIAGSPAGAAQTVLSPLTWGTEGGREGHSYTVWLRPPPLHHPASSCPTISKPTCVKGREEKQLTCSVHPPDDPEAEGPKSDEEEVVNVKKGWTNGHFWGGRPRAQRQKKKEIIKSCVCLLSSPPHD